jgi:hypothetical protein
MSRVPVWPVGERSLTHLATRVDVGNSAVDSNGVAVAAKRLGVGVGPLSRQHRSGGGMLNIVPLRYDHLKHNTCNAHREPQTGVQCSQRWCVLQR